jgi:hypothetical protein
MLKLTFSAQGSRIIIVLEKLVSSLLFCFVQFSFIVTRLMPYYAKTDNSCPLISRLNV